MSWLISRAHLRAHGLLQKRFASAGAHPYHYRLLAVLAESKPRSQTELVRATGIDRKDVSLALDTLCADGFATRDTHPSDRRRNIISITRRGRSELRRLDTVLDAVHEEVLAPLTAEERATFLGLIGRLGDPPDQASPDRSTQP